MEGQLKENTNKLKGGWRNVVGKREGVFGVSRHDCADPFVESL